MNHRDDIVRESSQCRVILKGVFMAQQQNPGNQQNQNKSQKGGQAGGMDKSKRPSDEKEQAGLKSFNQGQPKSRRP